MSPQSASKRNLCIANGRILDAATDTDRVASLFISDGHIIAVGEAPGGWQAGQTIDAEGHWVLPGIIDVAARLREPGQSHKATIASEAMAAVAAGVTRVCMPPDTDPVIDNPSVVEWIRHRAAPHALQVHPLGALTRGLGGEQISEMAALRDAGCVGVSNARQPLRDLGVLRHTMEYAATVGLTVFLQPEDPALRGAGCAHEGPVASRLGLAGIPVAAETAAIAAALPLVEQTGARLHLCRLSSARAAELVAEAHDRELPVTADVAAHQLFLCEMDISGFDALCHVDPPLRAHEDRQALREAVSSGVIGIICSDHQPHEADAKINPFPLTEPGISAIETLVPLALRLVEEGVLTPLQMVQRLSASPARLLGLEAGTLAPGSAADITIIDPTAVWELSAADLRSAGRHTPFAGWEFRGQVSRTLIGGEPAFVRD